MCGTRMRTGWSSTGGVFVDVWLSCLFFFVVEVMMVAVIVRSYRVKCCVCLFDEELL